MYVAGVFNGVNLETPSHRARVPAPLNIAIGGDQLQFIGAALDFEKAVFYRRYNQTSVVPVNFPLFFVSFVVKETKFEENDDKIWN